MDIVLIVVRLIHIVAGVFWVGGAVLMAAFIGPAVQRMGEDGGKFMKGLLNDKRFGLAFPTASGLTMLAGLILYALGAQNHFSSGGFIVLTIGALAGIGAGVHGGAVLGRMAEPFAKAQEKVAQSPTEENRAELQALGAKYTRHVNISVAMMLVALVGMSLARYL